MQSSQTRRSRKGHRRPGIDPQPPDTPDAAYLQKVRGSPGNGLGAAACLLPALHLPHPKHLVSPAPPRPPPLCSAPDTPEGDPGPSRAPVLLAWALPQGARGGRAGARLTAGRTPHSLPRPCRPVGWPQSTHFHSTCQSQDFDPDVCSSWPSAPPRRPFLPPARPGQGPRAAFLQGPRAGPGQQELRADCRVEAGGGGGVEEVEGVAAERAPGRCAGEQPGRARPGSGTGCPPREAEAHPTGEAGTCRPSQAGCPPALQAAASVPPSTPHGFQGSVPRLSRLSSLREPRSLQDGAAPASGARGCEATSAQPNAAPPRRSEGNRGTEGVESGCPRPCWLVPVPGPPAQDFLS
ncbi:translation initiation factor IF-2-like isoform X1 [Canis lupus familiaris]|uniref:translation initiation factor IF-2-like isoform X1 n=1 Tax=Canis lupus familiaris TaxID=9615 RepID=UPI0018F4B1AA|nr:translation initiation factor IF-2-like isoform X1 [Canis lupus familiaris]